MSRPGKGELNDDGYCFACGPDNPHGLHMRVSFDDDKACCRLSLGPRFQGWQGIAHGGIVSTMLDEIMAHAARHFVGDAVTAAMETRFRQPAPLEKPLLLTGWVEKTERRVVRTRAQLRLEGGDKVLAEASAKFILAPKG